MGNKKATMETFDSLDDAYRFLISSVLSSGRFVAPRFDRTLEVTAFSFTLGNVRRRLIENNARRLSLPLAIGEFCWHVSGSDDVRFIEYYARRWKEFAEHGSTVRGSCYGHRIFSPGPDGRSQWQRIRDLLRKDFDSRRAVLIFHEQTSDFVEDKDISCATAMQFLVRDSQLHAIVFMRSNDVIWGLPYDVFLFTMLQELLACELNLQLGTYTHVVGSLHIYERHFALAERIVRPSFAPAIEMPTMEQHTQLEDFLRLESRLRTSPSISLQNEMKLHSYWHELLRVLEWFRHVKSDRGGRDFVSTFPSDSLYSGLLSHSGSRRWDESSSTAMG